MVTPADLPRSVIAFMRTHVTDLISLRFLLAMHSAPSGTTTIALLARALDLTKTQVRDLATQHARAGLVRLAGEALELAPASIDDRLALSDLAVWYGRSRAAVIDALRALGRPAD